MSPETLGQYASAGATKTRPTMLADVETLEKVAQNMIETLNVATTIKNEIGGHESLKNESPNPSPPFPGHDAPIVDQLRYIIHQINDQLLVLNNKLTAIQQALR